MSKEFDNIIKGCKDGKLPTAIPEMLNDLDDTGWEETTDGSSYGTYDNDIGLSAHDLGIVRNGFKGHGDRTILSAIFNEMFHAIYDQLIEEQEERCPLYKAMKDEAKNNYGGNANSKSLEMVEEAMSESLTLMVSELHGAKALNKTADFSPCRRPPGHASSGQIYANEPAKYTGKKISKNLHVALAYFFFFGCKRLPKGNTNIEMVADMTKELKKQGVEFI